MKRFYNFSAGPSMLPESVLAKAADEMLCYESSGQSVMEMSHRSKPFEAIIAGAEALVRQNMAIPDDYHVLFLQGGASLQFHMLPLNFMTINKKADFTLTGTWAQKAAEEAKRLGTANIVGSSKDKKWSCRKSRAPTRKPTTSTSATTTPSRAPSTTASPRWATCR